MKRTPKFIFLLILMAGLTACQSATAVPPTRVVTRPGGTAAPSTSFPPAANTKTWWNDSVFYEVFVRSFYDSNADGIGDLNGLISKLDYLNDGNPATTNDLGVGGLWLMPIMKAASYHGYDPIDYNVVDPAYGTNDDFKRLISEAHKRGMRVIVDLVLNHTSDQHAWFQESRQRGSARENWYIWADKNPDYAGPWGQKVWHARDGRYFYGLFWEHQPDLNYKNPDVTAEMQNVGRFWLTEMGADGFRLDAARYVVESGADQANTAETHAWWKTYDAALKQARPDALTIGEVWSTTKEAASYVKNGEMNLAFDFDLAKAMVEAARTKFAASLASTQAYVWKMYSPNQFAPFLTNHDQTRVITMLGDDVSKAKVAAALLLTAPGVPFLYYGEEIGMSGAKPDEQLRTPMQWTAAENAGFSSVKPWISVKSDYKSRNVETQANDSTSLFRYYQTLIKLRNEHIALRVGDWSRVETDNGQVYAFLRHADQETLLVLANVSDKPIDSYALSIEKSALRDALTPVELLSGQSIDAPTLNAAGGFSAFRPFAALKPQTAYVIQLRAQE